MSNNRDPRRPVLLFLLVVHQLDEHEISLGACKQQLEIKSIILKAMQYRQDVMQSTMQRDLLAGAAKRQPACILTLTQKPKISIFAPHGRLVAPIHVKFGTAERHVGPLGRAKFQLNCCTGWVHDPKSGKFPFFVKICPAVVNTLTNFYKC